MNGYAPAAAPAVWQEARTADGRVYYYDKTTNKTTWEKPKELMDAAERSVNVWKEYTTPEGRKYWHNTETNRTQWEMPDALKKPLESQPPKQAPVQAPAFVAGSTSFVPQSQYGQHRDRDDYQSFERPSSDRYGYGGGDRNPVILNSQIDPEYSSTEEAELAFMKALKRAQVQPDWDWKQAVRAAIRDPQFRALKEPKDREEAFKKFCEEARTQEKEKERERQAKLRADFTSMLQSHPEIKYYTRWKTALPIIESETIFRSAKDDSERKQLFEQYIVSLKKAHAEKEETDHKSALDDLSRILQDLDLDPYTRWHSAQEQLDNSMEFTNDDKYRSLNKGDVLKAFEDHIKALERKFNDERQKAKRAKARVERQNRDRFLDLLQQLKNGGRLNAGTKWKDVCELIEDDSRYTAMLGQGGSTPLDLFLDAVDDEDRSLRSKKADVLDVLEDVQFEITLQTSFEEFYAIMQNDSRTASTDPESMKLIFERLRDKVAKRVEQEIHDQERQQRRVQDDLRYRIKKLDPPVVVGDTWEQVRPRLEKYEEYHRLDSDELRQAAFEKHMRRLERDEEIGRERSERNRRDHRDRESHRRARDEGEYRNGHRDSHRRHRTRTRSPEPDVYESERRKAQADRESRYRKSGNVSGLSPPRRDRDRREADRYGGRPGDHYDRERREREVERERSWVSRADPRDKASELDYGDSRPTSSRRRRESGGDSPASKRESKRLRRDTRERTFSPRRDRRSRTPAQPTVEPPKEDPGLRSGSEEGEIEED